MNKNKQEKDQAIKLLKGAYAIETPQDSIEYYRDFSNYYDSIFADALEYSYPKCVAEEFIQNFNGKGNICDIGCGTGLVGSELKDLDANLIIDGFDISLEMINKAKEKNIYRSFYELDLTNPINNVPNNYSAIISAGIFTHGHLGPEDLLNLLSFCQVDTLLTIGINASFYKKKGFKKLLSELQYLSKIKMINVAEHPIYSKKPDTNDDEIQTGIICSFVKIKSF